MSEEVLKHLVSTVEKHYQNSDKPLLLSRFGQIYPELRKEILKSYKRVGDAVRAVGKDQIEIVNPTKVQGQETIVVPEKRGIVEARSIEHNADLKAAEAALDRLPVSVQLAFCVKANPGERVAVQLARPFKFERQPEHAELKSGYVVVEEKFRHPSIHLKRASAAEKQNIWRSFLAWAQDNKLSIEQFSGSADEYPSIHGVDNALARFLSLQDPELLPRIRIPADVVEILLGHK